MFDIGFGEMLLLAAIALIAIGPKQLPEVARTIGRFLNQVKRATGDFQRTLADVGEQTNRGINEVQKTLDQQLVSHDFLNPQQSSTEQPVQPPQTQANAQMQTQPPAQAPHVATSAAPPAVDEHLQMSFDIDTKES